MLSLILKTFFNKEKKIKNRLNITYLREENNANFDVELLEKSEQRKSATECKRTVLSHYCDHLNGLNVGERLANK